MSEFYFPDASEFHHNGITGEIDYEGVLIIIDKDGLFGGSSDIAIDWSIGDNSTHHKVTTLICSPKMS